MGIASEEEQQKRGGILGAFLIAVILSIPFLNMLAGAVLVIQWGLKILMKSSNTVKDLSLFLVFVIAVGLAGFYGMSQMHGNDNSYVMIFLPTFLVAFFGASYLLKNIQALSD